MNNKSELSEWLFLAAGALFVGGFLAYENQATVAAWLATWQSAPIATPAANGGLIGLLTEYWGASLLVAALMFAWLKSMMERGAARSDDGQVDYSSPSWVDVTLIE